MKINMSIPLKHLFLIDGLGALLSAFLLGVVLVRLESMFGIPQQTLYILAFFPCLFAIYDFFCYLRIKQRLQTFLKGIAIANFLYCVLSIGFAIMHYQRLTYLGWMYILLEILVVMILVIIELKAASQLNNID